MKKIFIALLILGVNINLFAQDAFTIGLKAGGSIFSYNTQANLSPETIQGYRSYDENTKPGFLFGVFSRIHIWEPISIQPEAYYSRKTSEATIKYHLTNSIGQVLPISILKNTTLNFIDIPLLLHVKAVDLRSGNLYALAGPTISFITADQYELSSNISTIDNPDLRESLENALKNDFEKTTYSIQAGIGYEVAKFNFDIRYETGLNNLSKKNFDMTSSALMLNIALKFL